eukprot:124213-Pleurochrysis_carterae.AAC.3
MAKKNRRSERKRERERGRGGGRERGGREREEREREEREREREKERKRERERLGPLGSKDGRSRKIGMEPRHNGRSNVVTDTYRHML